MVLFDPLVQAFSLATPDRLQPTPGTILQAICDVTGNDNLLIGLATIDDDVDGPAMMCQRFF